MKKKVIICRDRKKAGGKVHVYWNDEDSRIEPFLFSPGEGRWIGEGIEEVSPVENELFVLGYGQKIAATMHFSLTREP
jgi:hypothetical protein